MDHTFQKEGLQALAAAGKGRVDGDGHLGAGLIAASWLMEQPEFETAAPALNRLMQGLCEDHGELFADRGFKSISELYAQPILEALMAGADALSFIGHDVIFATHALRALKSSPHLCDDSLCLDIAQLIQECCRVEPMAGTQWFPDSRYDVAATADLGDVDDYSSSEELAAFTFSEFSKYRKIFNVPYFRGYMLHHVTHAAALLDLYEMGFVEEFQELKNDHRRHAMFLRRLHNVSDDDWEKTKATDEDHTSAAFWSREFTDISDFPEDPLNWPVHLVKLH